MEHGSTKEKFATRWGFLFAAIGSAVGLGNIWRFPYIVGESGGGAFVLLYLVFIITLGVPALIAMIMIGRRGRQSPINSTRALAVAEGRSANWKYLGWLTVAAAYLALTFFSVVAGWTLDYMVLTAAGAFDGIDATASPAIFAALKQSAPRMALWHGVFMAFTIAIVARGVRAGVEKAVKLMMPALFLILLVLVVYAAYAGDFAAALSFMFTPDLAKIDSDVVLVAMGQAFFSLSVGGGGIIAYGAYLRRDVSIPRAAVIIATADTAVALLMGLAIFPLVMAYGLEAGSGPGLIFETLPIAFGLMPAGRVFGTLFFILVFFAALSTSISMLESVVSWLEEKKKLTRPALAAAAGGLAWMVGLGSVLSFNIWSGFKPLAMFETFQNTVIFGLLEYFTANIALPAAACLIAIFAGWIMSRHATTDELALGDGPVYRGWRLVMRWLAPGALIVIFVAKFLAPG